MKKSRKSLMRRSRWAIVVSGAAFTAVLFLGAAAGLAWALLPPLDPAPYLRAVASGQLLDRGGKTLYVALNREGNWSLPGAADDFSPYLRQATIAAEDQRFHAHPGVDPIAVLRAAWQNLQRGGVASGASTLTMQLVKLEGLDSRRPAGKLAQAVYALRLEKAADKDAILDAYLNRAPYGMNLIGADAAAWRYFGKRAQTLSLPEAALLAGLPRAPSRLNPLAHPERAKERRDYVLRRMHAEGFIDATQRDQALAAPVNAAWRDFPRHAPHLAVPLAAPLAAGASVTLTLDQALQARLETLLPHYLKRFNGSISNGALLVVDVETGELLARVGSAGFFATPGGGQVDSCLAPRSPGSTLKPFLFGWAMERQLLYPSEVLLDEVLDYGGYNPGNFDGLFNGPVTATEALRYSLNVPSVALLGRAGVAGFHDWLGKAGMTTLHRAPEEYGLGLVLGNCEARLEELARLYLSIASLGERNELRLTGAEPPQPAVFSPEVCRMLYAMLAQPFPEELSPGLTRTGGNALPVCWKTGTSTGYHDAWTFAFNRHYLVAVWLGNNSGATARQLIGARTALPLASRIFRELPPKNGPAWPAPEASDKEVAMCALSGLPATEGCPETARWRLPASFWRSRVCALHPVSRLGIAARAERPAGPASWDLATLAARPTGEVAAAPIRALGITVPANGAEFLLTGVDGGDQLRLQSTLGESEAVHWYVNDRYLGASGPDAPIFWALTSGAHRVTCVDSAGRTATARFTVSRPGGP